MNQNLMVFFSRDKLPKIKDVYVINLDQYSDIGTHWVALYVNNNNNNSVTYFDSFGVEHVPKEIKTFINRLLSFVFRPPLRHALQNKNITTNTFRIQVHDSIMILLILCLEEKL